MTSSPELELSAMLWTLCRHGVSIRLAWGLLRVDGANDPADAAVLEARRLEIQDHLLRSPGAQIIDYPDKLRLHPHGLQELLIRQHRKIGHLIDHFGGREKWLSHELTPERVAEIAEEIAQMKPKPRPVKKRGKRRRKCQLQKEQLWTDYPDLDPDR